MRSTTTRRAFRPARTALVAGLALASTLALAACGTTEAAAPASSSAASKITVTDDTGTKVTLDGPATKVVGTEWNVVEMVKSLGIDPVGAADVKGYNEWDSTVPIDPDTKDIGTRGEPSLDTIAALAPDLIVATTDLTEASVKQLREIAPVIEVTSANGKGQIDQMFSNLDLIAKATGTESKAAELKSDFDDSIAKDKKALADAGFGGAKYVFSDAWSESNQVSIRPYTKTSLIGEVSAELGLESAWTLKGDAAYGLASTDVEGLTKLGDVQFLYEGNDSDGGDVYADDLGSNAVWKSLDFVKDDQVHRLPDGIWMFGGPESMTAYADAVVAALVG